MGCFVRYVHNQKDCLDLMHDDVWKGGTRFYLKMAEGPGGGCVCVCDVALVVITVVAIARLR